MHSSFIYFHKPKCFIYLISISIIDCIKTHIQLTKPYYFNSGIVFRVFLYWISHLLSFFLCFQEKSFFYKKKKFYFISKTHKNKVNQFLPYDKSKFWFVSIMCVSTAAKIFGNIKYNAVFFNNNMKKIDKKFIDNYNLFILFLTYLFFENYFLKIRTYRHHLIAIGINLFTSLFLMIIELYNMEYEIIAIIFVYIIQTQTIILRGSSNIITKKLNHSFFVNMDLMLFIQGIIGMISLLIFEIFYVFIFKIENKFLFRFDKKTDNDPLWIDLLFFLIYSIVNCILYIFNYKIIEETKPSYLTISNGLTNIMTNIYFFIFKDDYSVLSFYNIFFAFSSFLGFCIFSEIITFGFWSLDKNTEFKTFIRGKRDAAEMMDNSNESNMISETDIFQMI